MPPLVVRGVSAASIVERFELQVGGNEIAQRLRARGLFENGERFVASRARLAAAPLIALAAALVACALLAAVPVVMLPLLLAVTPRLARR